MAQGNTPTGAPNGVVMPPLDPPGLYTRYASSQSTVLGWVQVVTGCMVITNAIMSLATYKDDAIAGDLFTGVLVSTRQHRDVINVELALNLRGREGMSLQLFSERRFLT